MHLPRLDGGEQNQIHLRLVLVIAGEAVLHGRMRRALLHGGDGLEGHDAALHRRELLFLPEGTALLLGRLLGFGCASPLDVIKDVLQRRVSRCLPHVHFRIFCLLLRFHRFLLRPILRFRQLLRSILGAKDSFRRSHTADERIGCVDSTVYLHFIRQQRLKDVGAIDSRWFGRGREIGRGGEKTLTAHRGRIVTNEGCPLHSRRGLWLREDERAYDTDSKQTIHNTKDSYREEVPSHN